MQGYPFQGHAGWPAPGDAWSRFRQGSSVKVGHVANAPHILSVIGHSGHTAKGFVTYKYSQYKHGQSFITLTTLAATLDARMNQLAGAPYDTIVADEIVETMCSEIAAMDYYLQSGDSVGEDQLRAVSGVDSYLASNAALSRATAAAKEAHKLATYKQPRWKKGKDGGKGKGKERDTSAAGAAPSPPAGK